MYSILLSPAILKAHLDDPDWVVVDCRFSLSDTDAGRRAYAAGHIPGAWYAHLDEDLSGEVVKGQTGRHPLPEIDQIAATFSRWGIGPGVQVVAYDDMGGAMAARLWWLLHWLGHDAVAVLDGGWPGWIQSEYPVSLDLPQRAPREFRPDPRPEAWADAGLVDLVRQDPEYVVVDSRAPERYRGEVEPIDPVAGHIPGAVNLPHFSNVGPDGRFLPREVLFERFVDMLKGRDPSHVIFYCGSGVTAAHNLLAMEHAGLAGGKIYPGSWSEWITDPDHQVAP